MKSDGGGGKNSAGINSKRTREVFSNKGPKKRPQNPTEERQNGGQDPLEREN